MPTNATLTTLFGDTISTTISGLTAHTWQAEASGLFHPINTNGSAVAFGAEWKGIYNTMLKETLNKPWATRPLL